jgi:hypothetical protein
MPHGPTSTGRKAGYRIGEGQSGRIGTNLQPVIRWRDRSTSAQGHNLPPRSDPHVSFRRMRTLVHDSSKPAMSRTHIVTGRGAPTGERARPACRAPPPTTEEASAAWAARRYQPSDRGCWPVVLRRPETGRSGAPGDYGRRGRCARVTRPYAGSSLPQQLLHRALLVPPTRAGMPLSDGTYPLAIGR